MSSVLRPAAPGQDPFTEPSHHGDSAETAADPEGPVRGVGRISASYRPISSHLAITPPVSVVIPAMNEAENLPYVFKTLPDWIHEVVLVDGNSTDDTVQVARELWPDVKVVKQVGKGKGDALISGFAACTGDIIVMVDADGSADGQEIVSLCLRPGLGRRLRQGLALRQRRRHRRHDPDPQARQLGAVRRVNAKFGARYTDLCYGYNAFWRRCLDKIDLDCTGFEIETLMNIRVVKAGLRVQEVPSHEYLRIHGVSNLRAVRDGLRVLRVILKEQGVQPAAAPPSRSPTLSLRIPRGEAS